MSDQAVLLPKWSPEWRITLAKNHLGHSYTFWTMPILIFSQVQIIIRHPLSFLFQRIISLPRTSLMVQIVPIQHYLQHGSDIDRLDCYVHGKGPKNPTHNKQPSFHQDWSDDHRWCHQTSHIQQHPWTYKCFLSQTIPKALQHIAISHLRSWKRRYLTHYSPLTIIIHPSHTDCTGF